METQQSRVEPHNHVLGLVVGRGRGLILPPLTGLILFRDFYSEKARILDFVAEKNFGMSQYVAELRFSTGITRKRGMPKFGHRLLKRKSCCIKAEIGQRKFYNSLLGYEVWICSIVKGFQNIL